VASGRIGRQGTRAALLCVASLHGTTRGRARANGGVAAPHKGGGAAVCGSSRGECPFAAEKPAVSHGAQHFKKSIAIFAGVRRSDSASSTIYFVGGRSIGRALPADPGLGNNSLEFWSLVAGNAPRALARAVGLLLFAGTGAGASRTGTEGCSQIGPTHCS
jgi:hypothetical protein